MRMLLPLPLLGVLLLMSLSTRADSLLITDALLFVGDASAPVTQDIHIVEGKIEATGADLSTASVDTVIDAVSIDVDEKCGETLKAVKTAVESHQGPLT